jgi:MFS family permease
MFWLMYLIFVLVASGGLMAAAQIGPIAGDYDIADVRLRIAGLVLPALTLAISLDRVLDGFGRPFFGWVSDIIGRENTMCIAFGTAGVSLVLLRQLGHNPWLFVLLTALFFGVFGEIYSLFPATCGDTFGAKYATTNAGMLYTAKGIASALVPLASLAAAAYGWSAVFAVAVAFNLGAAFLAVFVLKPLRARFLHRSPSTRGDPCRSSSIIRAAAPPAVGVRFAAELKLALLRVHSRQGAGSTRDRQPRPLQALRLDGSLPAAIGSLGASCRQRCGRPQQTRPVQHPSRKFSEATLDTRTS